VKLRIDKNSETPVHHQLREQIIFRISSGEVEIGSLMPGVRELERRLKIHRNTVSHVYSELEREGWLVKRPGRHFAVVQAHGGNEPGEFRDLNDLIDRTIQLALARGYSLQRLAHHVRRRLMAEPPDHFLLVEPEAGMGRIMKAEIAEATGHDPAACSVSSLLLDPSQAIGAILLTPAYLVDLLDSLPAKYRTTVVPLSYGDLYKYVELVAELSEPSIIGLVSVSMAGLKTMTGVLASALGSRHSMCAFVMTPEVSVDGKSGPKFWRYCVKDHPAHSPVRKPSVRDAFKQLPAFGELAGSREGDAAAALPRATESALRVADYLLCDSICFDAVAHPSKLKCRLLSEESLNRMKAIAKSLKPPGHDQT
jgi:DNA-binding transcriptional regulator YhcF (GntR family)